MTEETPEDATATDALLLHAGREAGARDTGEQPLPPFDGADLSAAGLGDRVLGAPWWSKEYGGVRLGGSRLAGASLRRANLSNADLSGADLAKATCAGIILRQARLEEANFQGADLIGAVLSEVDAGEANFSETLLEDAQLRDARLRFADFSGAVMDGADLSGADLWGARLVRVEAERTSLRGARLDEAQLVDADLVAADFTGATLRRANLAGARLRGAILRDAVLYGANLGGADLAGAVLPHVELSNCDLTHARFAGAWLERTRMRAHQLGGAIGEELAGEFEAAREGYIVLEQNFRTLGSGDDASWAFRRRRRMGKRLYAERARAALGRRDAAGAARPAVHWFLDAAAEWICDYGESVVRVLRTFLAVLVLFAVVYWATGCLTVREGASAGKRSEAVEYLLFSLDSMTTVGTSDVGLRPGSEFGLLLSSVETVAGTVLLGLFGFVLGARMRN